MTEPAGTDLLDAPITASRPHLSKAKAEQFSRLGIVTPRDLLYHWPRDYDDRRDITDIADAVHDARQTFQGIVSRVSNTHNGRMHRQSAKLYAIRDGEPDDREYLNILWFGQRHLANIIKKGDCLTVHGTVSIKGRRAFVSQPEYDLAEGGNGSPRPVNTAGIIPIYSLTAGMTQDYLRRAIRETLAQFRRYLHRSRPGSRPTELHALLTCIHTPDNWSHIDPARRQLAGDALLETQLALLNRRRQRELDTMTAGLDINPGARASLLQSLPFAPTDAQMRCMDEIRHDLAETGPAMNRLLQGEVGSGKTLVALAAAVDVASANGQTALLAPTGLLAEQHFHSIIGLLNAVPSPMAGEATYQAQIDGLKRPFSIALLTANTPARTRRAILNAAQLGTISLLVGTHAIISPDIQIPGLRLAVADEQHRFGTAQRAALRHNAHYLMLTATPIPRTVQLTLYRDLDVSTIDEMPIAKEPAKTVILAERQRSQAYDAIREAVKAGQQAFVIYPFIDPSSDTEGQAVTECYPVLRDEDFSEWTVRMIHGRMRPKEREQELLAFRNGETDILAATPIVEVGIDIPNATVMLIESSERFGLAQLHQLRGRIGRGKLPGACYIMITPGTTPGPVTRSRLRAIRDSNDGMRLAEADLANRGHGDLAGARQSGPDRMLPLGLGYDGELLEEQRAVAERIHAVDPLLSLPEHRRLLAARQRAQAGMDAVPTDH